MVVTRAGSLVAMLVGGGFVHYSTYSGTMLPSPDAATLRLDVELS